MLDIAKGFSGQNFPLTVKLIVLFACILFSMILFVLWKKITKPLLVKKTKEFGKEPILYKTLNLITIILAPVFLMIGIIFIGVL